MWVLQCWNGTRQPCWLGWHQTAAPRSSSAKLRIVWFVYSNQNCDWVELMCCIHQSSDFIEAWNRGAHIFRENASRLRIINTSRWTLTNRNSIAEEIKSRLRSGNACYHSVQNLLSSRLLSKNLKIKIYRTIILLVVLYGCETWSLTLREETKLRVYENMVLMRIFGPRRDEVTGEWRRLHNEELNDLYS